MKYNGARFMMSVIGVILVFIGGANSFALNLDSMFLKEIKHDSAQTSFTHDYLVQFPQNFVQHNYTIQIVDPDGVATLAVLYLLATQEMSDNLYLGRENWEVAASKAVELWPEMRAIVDRAIRLSIGYHEGLIAKDARYQNMVSARIEELKSILARNSQSVAKMTYGELSSTLGKWLENYLKDYDYPASKNGASIGKIKLIGEENRLATLFSSRPLLLPPSWMSRSREALRVVDGFNLPAAKQEVCDALLTKPKVDK